MNSKTDADVLIGGKLFTLSGYESEEYLQKVASYINKKIDEYNKIDSYKIKSYDYLNFSDEIIDVYLYDNGESN